MAVVVADLRVGPVATAPLRRAWLGATIALTFIPLALAVVLAPAAGAAPSTALVWLLFVGSSTHVGATAWFYCVGEVRAHIRSHAVRYVWVPVGLVVGSAVMAVTVSAATMTWVLLAFFGWQFFHFQKQNLGLAALAARSVGAARLTTRERRALTSAGAGGVCALVGHPALVQLAPNRPLTVLFAAGGFVFAAGVGSGLVSLTSRKRADRPTAFVCVYVISLLFFLPVFVFSSPYAAVAGLTLAHGFQYLLLVGLLAGSPSGAGPSRLGILVFVNVALAVGLVLNQASHLHGGNVVGRALFGVYLGVVMAHFVIDAGLWRLRDEFPRAFLTRRLPFLLAPELG